MKFWDEADGFIEGDIFISFTMLNRLNFKSYTMVSWQVVVELTEKSVKIIYPG